MENFIKSVDINCWRNVITGPRIPMKIVENEKIRKSEEEYTDADWNDTSINAKAINILHCALDATEYNKVSECKSATEVWEKLRVTYEGTDRVKESRINIKQHVALVQQRSYCCVTQLLLRHAAMLCCSTSINRSFFSRLKQLRRF